MRKLEQIKQWFVNFWRCIKGAEEPEIKQPELAPMLETKLPPITPQPTFAPPPIPRPQRRRPAPIPPMEQYGYIARYFLATKGNHYVYDVLTEEDGRLVVTHTVIDGKRQRREQHFLSLQDLETKGQFAHFRSSVLDTELANLL